MAVTIESSITIIRPKLFFPCPGLATMKAMKAPLAKAIKAEKKMLAPKKVTKKTFLARDEWMFIALVMDPTRPFGAGLVASRER